MADKIERIERTGVFAANRSEILRVHYTPVTRIETIDEKSLQDSLELMNLELLRIPLERDQLPIMIQQKSIRGEDVKSEEDLLNKIPEQILNIQEQVDLFLEIQRKTPPRGVVSDAVDVKSG